MPQAVDGLVVNDRHQIALYAASRIEARCLPPEGNEGFLYYVFSIGRGAQRCTGKPVCHTAIHVVKLRHCLPVVAQEALKEDLASVFPGINSRYGVAKIIGTLQRGSFH